jgi:hypothetical protein
MDIEELASRFYSDKTIASLNFAQKYAHAKDAENKRHERRVIAEQLIEANTNLDSRKYLLLLYSAASTLLSFSGYTAKTIYDAIRGYNHRNLSYY